MTDDTLLRRTLQLNVPVTLLWGTAAVAGAPWLDELIGAPTIAIAGFGAVALAAGMLFLAFARRQELRPGEGVLAGLGDLAFGGTLIVLSIVADLTTVGTWLVELSGIATAAMGLLELAGVRRLTSSTSASSTSASADVSVPTS